MKKKRKQHSLFYWAVKFTILLYFLSYVFFKSYLSIYLTLVTHPTPEKSLQISFWELLIPAFILPIVVFIAIFMYEFNICKVAIQSVRETIVVAFIVNVLFLGLPLLGLLAIIVLMIIQGLFIKKQRSRRYNKILISRAQKSLTNNVLD